MAKDESGGKGFVQIIRSFVSRLGVTLGSVAPFFLYLCLRIKFAAGRFEGWDKQDVKRGALNSLKGGTVSKGAKTQKAKAQGAVAREGLEGLGAECNGAPER